MLIKRTRSFPSSPSSPRAIISEKVQYYVAALLFLCALVLHIVTVAPEDYFWSPSSSSSPTAALSLISSSSSLQHVGDKPCAILLFGLPRGFRVVWPTLQKHVILPNAAYGCDYYVHAFDMAHEDPSRSGRGGTIDTTSALQIMQNYFANELPRDPMTAHLTRQAQIHVTTSTEEEFQTAHAELLQKVETVMDEHGRPVYVPWKHENYESSTTTNILKMWHSIQSAWQLMERTTVTTTTDSSSSYWSAASTTATTTDYSRMAVLRLDVAYMTPVDIFQLNATHRDTTNSHYVLPGFAQYPVNDRGIYGPREAVRAWATERFQYVDEYVQEYKFKRPGSGIHSERYLGQYLLPRRIDYRFPQFKRVERPDWCFYRVRADQSVWISDCGLPAHAQREIMVSYVTGCECSEPVKKVRGAREVTCCVNNQTDIKES